MFPWLVQVCVGERVGEGSMIGDLAGSESSWYSGMKRRKVDNVNCTSRQKSREVQKPIQE